MRISTGMIYNRFSSSLERTLQAIDREQEALGSGVRINRPSDDPTGMYLSMTLKSRLAGSETLRGNTRASEAVLEGSDAAIAGAQTALQRAYEFAVQFSNDTYTAADRVIGAQELNEIQKEIVSLANKMVGDRYIFGGHQTDAPAYWETIRITSGAGGNNQFLFDDGSGNTFTATLAAGYYTPEQLAAEIKSAMEAAASAAPGLGHEYAVTFDYLNQQFRIANDDPDNTADTLDLLWSNAGSTAAGALGFSAVDNSVTAGSSVGGTGSPTYERGFTVTASNNVMRVDFGAGAVNVALTSNAYTGAALAAEIKTQLEAADAGDTYTVTWDSPTKTFTVQNDTGNDAVTFDWADSASTASTLLGFTANQTLNAGESDTSDQVAQLSARYVYQGDAGLISVQTGSGGTTTVMNLLGDEVFDDALTTLDGFLDAMYANDRSGVQAALGNLSGSLDILNDNLAKVGARLTRISRELDRLHLEDIETQTTLSEVQDTDLVETTINLSRQQTALEALRTSGFQLMSRSLFDFLR